MDDNEVYQFSRSETMGRLPLSEQVYLTLKEAILRGKVKPGVKLNEVAIADQMEVSATPVREAFRKLAKDNLVVIKPWKGVRVKGYTAEEIVAMYQCREVMEGLGARLCAEHATEEQVEELKGLCQKMHSMADPEEVAKLHGKSVEEIVG